MKKFCNWIINYWWVTLICVIVVFIVFVSIINNPVLNRVTTTIFNYINQIIVPLGVILGLILGYPLIKRKLIDSYVTKQFEIIHENNRIIRKQCLLLKEKYPIKNICQKLDPEFLATALKDVKDLNELAIDANPDAYKYSYLLYKSLQIFSERTEGEIPRNPHELYYCETISTFVHKHIEHIYKYSKSIGFVPNNSSVKEKPILITNLKKYVIDNKYYHLEGIDNLFSYKIASALLVLFFSTNINCLSANNGLLFQCAYESVPSPSPFARIMYNRNIYMPLILKGEEVLSLLEARLFLVGWVRQKFTKLESGITTYYLICHYANITPYGFVNGCIKDKQSLTKYKDTYIGETVLNIDDIEEFQKNRESITIKIEERKAMKYFSQVKNLLSSKMYKEII